MIWRKKLKDNEIVENIQFDKLPQIKQIVIKRIRTKSDI